LKLRSANNVLQVSREESAGYAACMPLVCRLGKPQTRTHIFTEEQEDAAKTRVVYTQMTEIGRPGLLLLPMNSRGSNSGRRAHLPSSLSFSSSNQPVSPALVPAASIPYSKPAISLEEWERKAPLNDLQVRSVAMLAKATEHVPFPLKVSHF
jgi:hypothetical protein